MKNYIQLGLILLACTAQQSVAKLPDSVCYTMCNREACKIKEIQSFCISNCKESKVKNCKNKNKNPTSIEKLTKIQLKDICYAAFNRVTCKQKTVAKFAKIICKPEDIKNCMKAAGMKAE